MQYHLNGVGHGDPSVMAAADETFDRSVVDVLVVGSGPAGLVLTAQLAMLGDINVRLVEQKPGPLTMGQADGIACRSVEMFNAFGFAERVVREGYQVNETVFWRPGPDGSGRLHRADRIQDVADDLSEMPHMILSQARVHDFLLEVMANSPHRVEPSYSTRLVELERFDTGEYPVRATLELLDPESGEVVGTEAVQARFVVGCDGARSAVRAQLGQALRGESARQLWGVMDVLAVTDFPDIRLKCAIQSETAGSLLIIPREGGHLVRMYIELDELHGDERASDRHLTSEQLIARAQAVFGDYSLDVKEVGWWSAYEIGQRVCDRFDDVAPDQRGVLEPRIFIAGDACHTHSPKAGQGMNVSMADTFNLGWKLAGVVRGWFGAEVLDTYDAERHAKAVELIDFDRTMARLFSERPSTADEQAQFQRYFEQHGRYTAGVETRYDASLITAESEHQDRAAGLVVGTRFHSGPVVRVADAKPVQLAHSFLADGRWRLVAFAPAGDRGEPGGAIAQLCAGLDAESSVLRRWTPAGSDPDSRLDVRVVFPEGHRELDISVLAPLLLPRKGRHGLRDYEKVFSVDSSGSDFYELRGIDRDRGALVVVRPDQFVAGVFPLDRLTDVDAFFDRFILAP